MEKAIKKYSPIFLLPTMIAFAIGFIVPFVYGIFLSFCKFTTVTDWKWRGLQNYTRILFVNGKLDTTFIHSLWYTALFTVVSVLIINVVSFAIAMLLTKGIKGTNLFRTVFFMPNLIGGIVLSYIWLMIFNSVLSHFSKTIVSTQWYAFWGLILVVCWQQIGYMMIIYIAGIQNIPGELIEAAKIDGANAAQIFRKITLPYIMFIMGPYIITQFTGNINNFNVIYLLSAGKPTPVGETAGKTDLLVTWLYKLTVDYQYYNIGAVIGILTFVVLSIVALVTYRNTKAYKDEEGFM